MTLQKHNTCLRCRANVPVGANFCPTCGSSVGTCSDSSIQGVWAMIDSWLKRFLMAIRKKTHRLGFSRSANEKAVAGVCAGLAQRFGWNLALVRCCVVFAMSFGFAPAFVYGLCWLFFDERPTSPK